MLRPHASSFNEMFLRRDRRLGFNRCSFVEVKRVKKEKKVFCSFEKSKVCLDGFYHRKRRRISLKLVVIV